MLSFATEFPTSPENSIQDFWRAIRVWILDSPHKRLSKGDLADLVEKQKPTVEKNDESLDTLILKSGGEEVAGVRIRERQNDLEWTTEIVFNKRRKSGSWIGIQVFRQSSSPTVKLPRAKTPIVIRKLLDEFGEFTDGVLPVSDKPHELKHVDVDTAAQLILGKGRCHLPVVYVSAGFHGDHGVNFRDLARDLAGMAHVVVEPNREFSLRLQMDVDSENIYGGAVGVYWPEAAGRRSFFIGRDLKSPERAIFDEIREALTNRRSLDRCTWSYLQEAESHQRYVRLRESASEDKSGYLEIFEEELSAKQKKIDKAEKEIERLRGELREKRQISESDSHIAVRRGHEQDFYPNEIYGIVRDALEDAFKRVPEKSRRSHVLSAVLAANDPEDGAKSKREEIKRILKGRRILDERSKNNLKKIGFAITDDGKHHKLVFQGDGRYTYIHSKTSSDVKSGDNAASLICRMCF